MDTSEKLEAPEASCIGNTWETDSGVKIEVTEASDEENGGELASQAAALETPLFDLSSDEEPVVDKKNESADDILREVCWKSIG